MLASTTELLQLASHLRFGRSLVRMPRITLVLGYTPSGRTNILTVDLCTTSSNSKVYEMFQTVSILQFTL